MKAFFHNDKILASFSDRFAGVSNKPYELLNIATHVGDKIESVLKNRVILGTIMDFDSKKLIYMEQTHGSNIEIIRDNSKNRIENCDAIITDLKNTPLMVMVADCLPILIYDRVNGVVSAVHAGRNSSFKEIVKKVILKMESEFGSSATDILVSIGASINSCCYEVDNSLALVVLKSFGKRYIETRDNKQYLDLQKLNFDQLIDSRIQKKNIEISDECSCCSKQYFSYRRDGVTGRFAGIVMIRC